MAKQGSAIWDAFVDAHRGARLPGDTEIPMEYFTRAVEYVLIESVGEDSSSLHFNSATWTKAVDFSGFDKALELVSPGLAEP